jgi:hypothetical protein
MKKVSFLWVVIWVAFSAHSQTADKTQPAPEALKVNVTAYNFGKIVQGKPVTYDFIISNAGNQPLQLNDVHASCGCTTPVWSKEPIAPGASTKINVGFNAMAYGPFEKSITITYNNGETKVLTIKGEVRKTADNSAPANSVIEMFKQ